MEVGQVWVVFPEQKNAIGVFVCVLDIYEDAALIVLLHNKKQLRSGIEPWVVLDFLFDCKMVAVVERTLAVSFDAFRPNCHLGKISPEQVDHIKQAEKEFQQIFFANSRLEYLEAHGHETDITDELLREVQKKILFWPVLPGHLDEMVNLHYKLQAVVQRHHEKLFFG